MRALVYFIIFISFFDLFTQLPIMSPFAQSLGASPFLIGLTVGMYSFSNTIGNVASGFLTDRNGPFRILLIGLLSTSVALFLYFFATSPLLLLAVRFIHGLTAGLIVPAAFTFLANIAKKEEKGKSSAISGAFVGSAAILGPAFSGIVASRMTEMAVFATVGFFMFALSIFAYFYLRHSFTVNEKEAVTHEQWNVRALFQNHLLIKSFAGAFFLMFSQGVLAYLLPLKALQLGGTTQTSGLLLSTFGVVAVLVFLLPINRLFDRLPPLNTLAFGMIVMGGSLLFVSNITEIDRLFIAMACYGVGFAFLFPSINSLLIEATSDKNRGKAYGYFYAFFSIGVIVGSAFTGMVSRTVNAGFLVTAIIVIIAALFIRFMKPNEKRSA